MSTLVVAGKLNDARFWRARAAAEESLKHDPNISETDIRAMLPAEFDLFAEHKKKVHRTSCGTGEACGNSRVSPHRR